jgi:hypothetical protein
MVLRLAEGEELAVVGECVHEGASGGGAGDPADARPRGAVRRVRGLVGEAEAG